MHIRKLLLVSLFMVTVLCGLLLGGCGFHLRNNLSYPGSLQSLNLDVASSDNPYFKSSLMQYLTAMSVDLTTKDKSAFTLKVDNISYKANYSALTSGSSAITVGYNFSFKVSIVDSADVVVVPAHVINLHKWVTQNSSQINTSSNNTLIMHELNRDAISRINDWLVSSATKDYLLTSKRGANAS